MKSRKQAVTFSAPRAWTGGLRWMLFGLALAAPSAAEHLAREDPPEPIFTQRAFIENNIEVGIDWGRGFGTQELEIGLGTTWVFFERLQLGTSTYDELVQTVEADLENAHGLLDLLKKK